MLISFPVPSGEVVGFTPINSFCLTCKNSCKTERFPAFTGDEHLGKRVRDVCDRAVTGQDPPRSPRCGRAPLLGNGRACESVPGTSAALPSAFRAVWQWEGREESKMQGRVCQGFKFGLSGVAKNGSSGTGGELGRAREPRPGPAPAPPQAERRVRLVTSFRRKLQKINAPVFPIDHK